MNTKNDVEVIINGKQYTLSGYESSEYLQRIANHINDKLAEFRQSEGYARLDGEMKNILLAINLSDDYYKVQERVDDLQKEKEELEQEIFNIKHDMIEMKALLEKRGEEIESLQRDKTESEHRVIRLETELEGAKAENSLVRGQAAGIVNSVPDSNGGESGSTLVCPGSESGDTPANAGGESSNITESGSSPDRIQNDGGSISADGGAGSDNGTDIANVDIANQSDDIDVGNDNKSDGADVGSDHNSENIGVSVDHDSDSSDVDSNLSDDGVGSGNVGAGDMDGSDNSGNGAVSTVVKNSRKNSKSSNNKKRHRRSRR